MRAGGKHKDGRVCVPDCVQVMHRALSSAVAKWSEVPSARTHTQHSRTPALTAHGRSYARTKQVYQMAVRQQSKSLLYIGPISASPTACLLRGYGCAGTPSDRLRAARFEYRHVNIRATDMLSATPR